MINSVSTLLSGIIIAFAEGPIFAIICFAYFPLLIIIFKVFGAVVRKNVIEKMKVAKELGGIVEETL
jgi:ABC-type bacteriocin/lantibiotic exporter with double-glycine peptidase domain